MEKEYELPHKMSMEQRRTMKLSGVMEVISFDLKHVLLKTNLGMLRIQGNELKIKKVSLENGDFQVDGKIDRFEYTDEKDYQKKGKNFLKRAFR